MHCTDLVSIADLSVADIHEIFATAKAMKASHSRGRDELCLRGKTLGMIFEKYSMRTRVSFEVAMTQLGGHALYLTKQDINLGQRESVKDGARVLSRYVDCIVIRTYGHDVVLELAEHATIPVINGLSDYSHPCQALTDVFTVLEKLGGLKGVQIAFVGDGNNVARSLAMLCAKLGITCVVASPKKYELTQEFLRTVKAAADHPGCVVLRRDPKEAVRNADVIYTDSWISMGQEAEAEARRRAFRPYQVNQKLVACAKKDVLVMHCLPAHRGEEITDDVIDGPSSIVYDQAENRLHVQKALLKLLMGKRKGSP
ncbi:MAG: ornithine carbamoyltransferase [Planctomycetes bacterium]|nr:ornithine carbamoyltransferase [Planctomycetota bacterium]